MMEERDLPVGARGRKRRLQPVELRLVQVIGVEREEAHAPLGQLRQPALGPPEGVVALTSHVEGLVETLVRVVVIAEDGMEHDACIEQRFIGCLELGPHVLGAIGPVDVVAEHEHEVEGELVVGDGHPLRHLVLLSRVPPCIAHHRESDGAVLAGQSECAGDRRLDGDVAEGCRRGGAESQQEDEEQTADHRVVHASHLVTSAGAAAGSTSTTSWATPSTRMRSRPTKR